MSKHLKTNVQNVTSLFCPIAFFFHAPKFAIDILASKTRVIWNVRFSVNTIVLFV